MKYLRTKQSSRRRGALQAAELLVVLPVLGLIGMGLFQYGMFFMHQQRLEWATDAACRVAAQDHPSERARIEAAEEMFFEALGDVAWQSDCEIEVSLREQGRTVIAAVDVSVPSQRVLPDLLGWIGMGIQEADRMTASALMPLI